MLSHHRNKVEAPLGLKEEKEDSHGQLVSVGSSYKQ